MTAALVVREKGSKTALERVQTALKNDLNNPSALIKAVLPNINLRGLISPLTRQSPNVIRVNLDSSSVCPGDTIRGTLKLMISEPVPVQDVTIQLWGRSITYGGLWNSWGTRVPFESFFTLVDKKIQIDVGATVLSPRIYEFPFEIELPRTVTITQEDWPFNELTKRFNDNFTQPLPPSFLAYSTAHAHVDCSIKYFVIGQLNSNQEKQDIKHKIPLTVKTSDARALMGSTVSSTSYMKCPFHFKFTSDVAAATAQTLSLELGKCSRGTSISSIEAPAVYMTSGLSTPKRNKFKELAKDSLLRFKLPEYFFDLDAEIPRGGRASQVLPITLRLGWHPPKSKKLYDQPPPRTTLTGMKVQLQSRFMTRGVCSVGNYNNTAFSVVEKTATWHCVWRSQAIVISELKDPIELGPETDMSSLMFVHPHKFLPAFKTFSIGREYVLQVICDLTCAGELFQAKFEVEGFNILAEGDGTGDDFFDDVKPKLHRRPNATYDYAGEEEERDEDAENDGGAEPEAEEDYDDVGAEDELFRVDEKKSAHKVTVEEVRE